MKFGLKVQCLPEIDSSGLQQFLENELSIAVEIFPTSEGVTEKKGHLYLVLNVKSQHPSDLRTPITLFIESLKDHYYKSDDESILHALEKSLKRSSNILSSLKPEKNHKNGPNNIPVAYNFCAAVISDRVLYLSYIGEPAAYLIRGAAMPRELINKGNPREIWTQTNILLGDEIILIGTEAVAKQFPPDKLISSLGTLSNSINSNRARSALSAILIKVTPIHTKTSLKSSNIFKYEYISHWAGLLFNKLNFLNKTTESLSDQFKRYHVKKSSPILSLQSFRNNFSADLNLKGTRHYSRLFRVNASNTKSYAIKIAILIILVGAIFIGIKYYFDVNNPNKINSDLVSNISNRNDASKPNIGNDTKPINQEIPFQYDLTRINPGFDLLGISYFKENQLVVLDKQTKGVYLVNLTDKTNKKLIDKMQNPEYLTCQDLLCYILDEQNIYLINPDKPGSFNKFFIGDGDVIDIRAYLGVLYILTTNKLRSLTINSATQFKLEDVITETAISSRSVAVDQGTYILQPDSVLRYANGKQDMNFKLSSQIDLKDPSQITILDNKVFILEPQGHNLVIADKNNGNYIETKNLPLDPEKSPSFFTVGDRRKQFIYYTSDNKIYLYQ